MGVECSTAITNTCHGNEAQQRWMWRVRMGGESTECINERSGVGVTAKDVGHGMCEWVKCVALALFGQVMKMKDCFEVSICGWD